MPVGPTQPSLRSAPVLAILVCHNGAEWLPQVLAALRAGNVRPRHVLAVDTGSTDATPTLLAAATAGEGEGATPGEAVLDGVLTLEGAAGFGAALDHAVEHAVQRWGDPGKWLWLLHDDCAPEPECLDILLRGAEASPSAEVLGPLELDWAEPRLIVEAGVSLDASGHRHQVVPADVPDAESAGEVSPEQTTEMLAVPTAGTLISRRLWESLGGFDPELSLLGEDVDFGWRANVAGSVVLCVPAARIRHARALTLGDRDAAALRGPVRSAQRAHGLRTLLVNCSTPAYLLGLTRTVLLCLVRALVFALSRDGAGVRAELLAIGYLAGGHAGLRRARASRVRGSVRGLFTSRTARFRGAVRGAVLQLVRRRVASEAALGRLPEHVPDARAWIPPATGAASGPTARPAGPDALPDGARRTVAARSVGLRKPAEVVAVSLPDVEQRTEQQGKHAKRPSPGRTDRSGDVVFVEVGKRRIAAATVLAPPVVLAVALTALALVVHWGRLGLDLAGGQLLPVGSLGQVWSTYLSAWHAVSGGTGAAAPVALAVLGILGAPFAPVGGPAALVAILLLGDLPLAALSAYAASARMPVRRWVRAGAAAAYALLPVATAAVVQGRLSIVVVHILLPPLIAGIWAVLTRSGRGWLSVAVGTGCVLAVIGAFSPLAHVLALTGLLAGVLATRWPGGLVRTTAAVAVVVFLPLGLLLPWLPTLVMHPELILLGLDGMGGGRTPVTLLAGLDPGGPGALAVGTALVIATIVAVVIRPGRQVLPGSAMVLLGVAAVAVVRLVQVPEVRGGAETTGYPGVGLLVAGAGLLLMVLGTMSHSASTPALPGVLRRLGSVGAVVVLLALASGVVLGGSLGPADTPETQRTLHDGGGWQLASSLRKELSRTSRAVLVLGTGGEPPRQVAGRLPRFGDDALIPVPGSAQRLARWQRELLADTEDTGNSRGDPDMGDAVTSAVAAGVLFVVLPPGRDGSQLLQSMPELVSPAPPTSNGRTVLRLDPVGGPVMLLAPVEAHRAVSGKAPSGELADGAGTVVGEAELPHVRVRVSGGPAGRLLVLAAELEPGWSATVNGEPVPLVAAWGHQVGVAIGERSVEVELRFASARWEILLLVQLACVLFALLTVVPGRRRNRLGQGGPSMTSGSTPR